jgi:hypothetical protein
MSERDEAIQRVLDGQPDYCGPTPDEEQMIRMGAEDAICVQWAKPGVGFGNLVFYFNLELDLGTLCFTLRTAFCAVTTNV